MRPCTLVNTSIAGGRVGHTGSPFRHPMIARYREVHGGQRYVSLFYRGRRETILDDRKVIFDKTQKMPRVEALFRTHQNFCSQLAPVLPQALKRVAIFQTNVIANDTI